MQKYIKKIKGTYFFGKAVPFLLGLADYPNLADFAQSVDILVPLINTAVKPTPAEILPCTAAGNSA